MKMERYLPSAILSPFIKAFLVIESEDGMENSIIPDTSVVMAFRYKGNVTQVQNERTGQLPETGISGLRKSVRLVKYAPGTGNLLVMFREGGAAPFFKAPLHELFEANQALEELIHLHKIKEVEEQLSGSANTVQRIAVVEKFLLSELKTQQPDLLVSHAVQQIKAANGSSRIKTLAADLYISQDAFEKRFRRSVGASPKQFSAIVRLRHLLDHYQEEESLTAAAYRAGYFDQAHFIKDFKTFTGQSPQAFFQSAAWW